MVSFNIYNKYSARFAILAQNNTKGKIMDENARYKLAKEIMSRAMAIACTNGFDPTDPVIASLLEDERELKNFNKDVIEKIIEVYSQVIQVEAV